MKYYLNIGSNLGDRQAVIKQAIGRLAALGSVEAVSSSIETPAWGFVSQHEFLNVGLVLESHSEPLALLHAIHSIERGLGSSSHRTPEGGYADRLVDIDVVAIDGLTLSTSELTVPHPHLPEREFYLAPMAQIAPHWQHPTLHLTAAQMLSALRRNKG
ncbi:MAG: 2-amino-4-hydroxy-6-hydroxymethyldihydropteridine diphosphokinase [Bacteroidales bacterium]|nr:2-amino-4-hydroxy-6-hydroxymethyldihydropteridine diphosphokinase [Bacteroidales bacterium]MDY3912766.1 2-amino-4-hydroxy-6-hydroxymethyldihydropteridine diphosphokinase [Sodaliphilus sp.]